MLILASSPGLVMGDENIHSMADEGNLKNIKRSRNSNGEDEAEHEMEESDGDEVELSSESGEDE